MFLFQIIEVSMDLYGEIGLVGTGAGGADCHLLIGQHFARTRLLLANKMQWLSSEAHQVATCIIS